MSDMTNLNIKRALRRGPTHYGGYRSHFLTSDGATLCHACVRKEWRSVNAAVRNNYRDGWKVIAEYVHWEGPPESCDHCNKSFPSEYGDPDAQNDCIDCTQEEACAHHCTR